jgi:hypothetical protein
MKLQASLVAALGLCACLVSSSTRAADNTTLVVPPTYAAHYSQAVDLQATLTDESGPVAGVRVQFRVATDGVPEFLVDDPVTDANGVAHARLVLVDDAAHNRTFKGAPTGQPYVVTARFLGDNVPPADCGNGTHDGTRCPSEATSSLALSLETPTLAITPGTAGGLGDTVTLSASLDDDNGDAPASGTAIDGSGKKLLAGLPIGFFFDLNHDGRPSADELIDTGTTNDLGVASVTFKLDPLFVKAGVFDDGIQARFDGDDHYAIVGASSRIDIHAGPAKADKTLLTATPNSLPANGFALVELRATLVDAFGSVLDVNSPEVTVAFTTNLGFLQGKPARDELTGQYTQSLRVGRKGGTAHVTMTVDGQPGPSVDVVFTGGDSCACVTSTTSAPWLTWLLSLLVPVAMVMRRPRRTQRRG